MKERIDQLLVINSKEKIEKNKIRDSLQKLHDIMFSSEPIYQVFEWKDNQIFILDPPVPVLFQMGYLLIVKGDFVYVDDSKRAGYSYKRIKRKNK